MLEIILIIVFGPAALGLAMALVVELLRVIGDTGNALENWFADKTKNLKPIINLCLVWWLPIMVISRISKALGPIGGLLALVTVSVFVAHVIYVYHTKVKA